MSDNDIDRIWTLLAKRLAGEATGEELLELKKLESHFPEISYQAQLIVKWWYLDKIEEQTRNERRE